MPGPCWRHADLLDDASFQFGGMPRHNLPPAVSAHPDIRESAFVAECLAVFVRACEMVSPCRYCKVSTVHAHVEGGNGHDGLRVGIHGGLE